MPVTGKFKMIRLSALLLTALVVAPVSWASPLSDAKEAGLVQEKADGYVAGKKGAAQKIQQLVEDVNERRREAYKKIAAKNGVNIEQVARASYERRHPQ